MATFYLKSGSGVTQFAQSTAYVAGDRIVPVRSDAGSNYLVARRWVWECTTPGTTAAANPTWPASVTQDVTTVTSNTAVFTARKPGFSSGTTAAWSFATIFIDYISSGLAIGDTLYISNNHAESVNAAISIGAGVGITYFICVDDSVAPPTALATTATITTTGNSTITFNLASRSGYYCYGVNFIAGSGASGTASVDVRGHMEECSFQIASTGTSSVITVGAVGGYWKNCDVKFAAAQQGIAISAIAPLFWDGGSLLSGGTSPTALFTDTGASVFVNALDLTNANAAINLVATALTGRVAKFTNIKLPASWSGSVNSSAPAAGPITDLCSQFTIFNGDNSGTNYTLNSKQPYGTIVQETTVVKSGGLEVAGTPISWKVVNGASAGEPHSYTLLPTLAAYNSTAGSPVTATVDFIHDSATALTDREIFLEVTYLGSASSPLGTIASSYPGILTTASDLAASTATWTTTGLTNPNAQKMSVTFTPQLAGMIIGRVKLCKASKTVYVDPVLQLS